MLLDFDTLTPPRWPNYCLAAPADLEGAKAQLTTPSYAVPLVQLREALVAVAAGEPRTNLLRLDKEALQAEFEQRSRLFGFRDTITVAFISLDDERSTLMLYSRARVGLFDLGVNRKRVERWLALLSEKLAGQG